MRTLSRLIMVGALLALFSLALVGGRAVIAQNSTPEAGGEGHPAHLHEGTCDDLNPEPLFPLTDVTAGMTAGTPAAAGETVGPASAVPVETSETTIEAALTDIVEGDHAINIHESVANVGNYIACGDIGGAVVDNRLILGLRELNESGHSGIAVLEAADGQTKVTVYLAEGLSTAADGGTESTPAADAETGTGAVMVDVKDFTYQPDPIEIPVGGTVTWTNQDSAPHTATARDRDVLQSGTLNEGDSYSETFEEAGTYAYFCEFHPNMKGTVVVE